MLLLLEVFIWFFSTQEYYFIFPMTRFALILSRLCYVYMNLYFIYLFIYFFKISKNIRPGSVGSFCILPSRTFILCIFLSKVGDIPVNHCAVCSFLWTRGNGEGLKKSHLWLRRVRFINPLEEPPSVMLLRWNQVRDTS